MFVSQQGHYVVEIQLNPDGLGVHFEEQTLKISLFSGIFKTVETTTIEVVYKRSSNLKENRANH